MDPAQQTPTTPVPSPSQASSTGLFGTKIPASAAFLIAVLLFLLPFAEVKCNGAAMASNTGLGIATGSEWKEEVTKNIFGNSFDSSFGNDQPEHKKEMEKQDPNKFAIAALALGIIGLLIAFLASKSGGTANLIIGILAAASLIAMLIDLRSKAKSDNSIKSSDFNAGVSITVDGTSWCYLAIILFILGGIFCYMRGKTKLA
jgi:hypothetical protein